jgi:hypothetical protein
VADLNPRGDLMDLGEGLYRVSREQNKADLCPCPDRFKHKPECIWFAAYTLLPKVRRAIDQLEMNRE